MARWSNVRVRSVVVVSALLVAACGDGADYVDAPTRTDGGGDGGGGVADAGHDATAADAATPDAANADAATADAAAIDAAPADAAAIDAAPADAAPADATTADAAPDVPTGTGIEVVPPLVSVIPNQTESDTAMLVFAERTAHTLTAALPVDLHVATTYTTPPNAPAEIPAGTTVDVHFVHFDPVGTSEVARVATIVTTREILGVIALSGTLDATDGTMGVATTTYPAAGTHTARGLDFPGEDELIIGADRRTITLDLRTSTSSDQLRIVTLATGAAPRLTSINGPVVAAPASVVAGGTETNVGATVFVERTGALTSDVAVDLTAPGTYTGLGQLTPGVIVAGTSVRCYLVHLDSVGGAGLTRRGTITFQGAILGMALQVSTLDGSDATCGNPTTTYPTGVADRDVELSASEVVLWSADGRSVRYDLGVTTGVDQLRILVAE